MIINFKLEYKLKKLLEKEGKLSSYIGLLAYAKERIPLGGFSKSFENFYDKDDFDELKELKKKFIQNLKYGRKLILLNIVIIIVIMILM
jgi:hypothetical protein